MNKHIGSSFDDFLKEEGVHEEVTAAARKRKTTRALEQRAEEVLGSQYKTWLERAHRHLDGKTPYEQPEEALEILTRIEHGVFF